MSNDLISRSALIERVSGKSYTLSNVPTNISGMLKYLIPYIVKDILNDIENAKTAYNVDEVMRQLEKKSRGGWGYPSVMEFDDVVHIVKAGGVNE